MAEIRLKLISHLCSELHPVATTHSKQGEQEPMLYMSFLLILCALTGRLADTASTYISISIKGNTSGGS